MHQKASVLDDLEKYNQVELLLRGLRDKLQIEGDDTATEDEIEDLLDIIEIAEALNALETGKEVDLKGIFSALRHLYMRVYDSAHKQAKRAVGEDHESIIDERIKWLDEQRERLLDDLTRDMASLGLFKVEGLVSSQDFSPTNRKALEEIISRFLNQ